MSLALIESVWQSKDSLAQAYHDLTHLSSFDQTKGASALVTRVMAQVLGDHFTDYDARQWVKQNVTDFNLASQLLLNCQRGFLQFDVAKLEQQVKELEESYKDNRESGTSPFRKKAKFIEGNDTHNAQLSQVRNLAILANHGAGVNSYRVSPTGHTPAVADALNLTSLSIAGLTPICSQTEIWLLNLQAISEHISLRTNEDGLVVANDLHPIKSESGGELVFKALASRWIALQVLYAGIDYYVVPKYDSIMITGGPLPQSLQPYAQRY